MSALQQIKLFGQTQKAAIKADLLRAFEFLIRPIRVRVIVILAFFLGAALAHQGGYEQGMRYATYLAENKLYSATESLSAGGSIQYGCPYGGTLDLSPKGQPTGFCHKP